MDNRYYIRLGQRIRERRKKLRITQNQLCGDKITRNMLSQIENGIAHPSLETLLFLAEGLGVSPSYLVCIDEKDESLYRRIEFVKEIRRLFSTEQYEKCAKLCHSVEGYDDEVFLILSRCEFEMSLLHFRRSELTSCLMHLDEAEKACGRSSYFVDRIIASTSLLKLLIRSVTAGAMPKPSEVSEINNSFFDNDTYMYILALSMSENGDNHICRSFESLITNTIYRKYLTARGLIEEERYAEALPLLREVAGSDKTGCLTEYFSLRDLESCCQKCDSYKEAYECARKRMALPDKYTR